MLSLYLYWIELTRDFYYGSSWIYFYDFILSTKDKSKPTFLNLTLVGYWERLVPLKFKWLNGCRVRGYWLIWMGLLGERTSSWVESSQLWNFYACSFFANKAREWDRVKSNIISIEQGRGSSPLRTIVNFQRCYSLFPPVLYIRNNWLFRYIIKLMYLDNNIV
jgi:hypothetical protein